MVARELASVKDWSALRPALRPRLSRDAECDLRLATAPAQLGRYVSTGNVLHLSTCPRLPGSSGTTACHAGFVGLDCIRGRPRGGVGISAQIHIKRLVAFLATALMGRSVDTRMEGINRTRCDNKPGSGHEKWS